MTNVISQLLMTLFSSVLVDIFILYSAPMLFLCKTFILYISFTIYFVFNRLQDSVLLLLLLYIRCFISSLSFRFS
jgi:hypothetical protein